ncbi:MAG: LysR family transcriptional regulator [Bradyrhizobium sp.]|nr:LysR family transcriptional regulator [Bradyrhizobium sp.]
MNTRFLETLVWLSRLRSFSRTAEALNASQPAISNRINKLEELLGVQLYDRTTREFSLTPAGRRILRHAELIVRLSGELTEMAASEITTDCQIRIGVVELVTISWLPAFTAAISALFPKTSFYISTDTSPLLLKGLTSGDLDIAFLAGPVNEPGISSRALFSARMSWLASTDNFDTNTEIDIIELSRLPLLLPRPSSSGYDMIIEYFRTYGILDVPSQDTKLILDCVYSFWTAAHLVRSGLGVSAISSFLFREEIEAGRVGVVPVRQALQPTHITACVKRPTNNPVIDQVIEIAASSAADYDVTRDEDGMWI